MNKNIASNIIKIKGRVQGVGFRPFVYRYAKENNIKGNVLNATDGVYIEAEAKEENLNKFITDLNNNFPRASQIDDFTVEEGDFKNYKDFEIIKSEDNNSKNDITEVSPDISVCEACLKDIKTQENRINYAFTNCTDCGPRFTIIKDLPYDREQTTMKEFKMCKNCESEYTNVMDRRFHAQPVACNDCGPHYYIYTEKGKNYDINSILQNVKDVIQKGEILALKGLGGYHLICDANNENAVNKLREQKHRKGKPLAVMFKDYNSAEKYCKINTSEKQLLTSWQKPITLLKEKKSLAKSVCNNFNNIGAVLPYMPMHYMIFENIKCDALIFTSGNMTDEPVIIEDSKAKSELSNIAGLIVSYNREIHNRADDSVVQVINNKKSSIRRARGYVPTPLRLNLNTNNILAVGAELVNTFAIGRGKQAIVSQHIGDLKNIETLEFFEESIERFSRMFQLKPELIVHDLHPEYMSSKFAKETNIKSISVQHHHSHIASCMAEHNLDEKVIGVSFDGTGLGDDGKIWGGEFFICDLNDYKRVSHFDYIPIPGGDKATKENWRTGLSYLYKIYGEDYKNLNIDFVKNLDKAKADFIIQMIDKNINSPLSSSAGRLFDAVSAILNICTKADFHAEAPMRLESNINEEINKSYSFEIKDVISFENCIKEIVTDLENGISKEEISAKFHNTIIDVVVEQSKIIREKDGINKVVHSGGSFQNIYLSKNIENKLSDNKFEVFSHSEVPANDGGLSLGQLAIAAKRRELKLL